MPVGRQEARKGRGGHIQMVYILQKMSNKIFRPKMKFYVLVLKNGPRPAEDALDGADTPVFRTSVGHFVAKAGTRKHSYLTFQGGFYLCLGVRRPQSQAQHRVLCTILIFDSCYRRVNTTNANGSHARLPACALKTSSEELNAAEGKLVEN